MLHRPFPIPRRPIILFLRACPRSAKAMRTLIAKHLSAEIRIPTPRAIHHHHHSASYHHRRVLQPPAEAAFAQCHNQAPARNIISPPYPHHSNIHSLHHSHMPPCLPKGAAKDTPPLAYRPTDRVGVPRSSSLAQDQEGRADQGDACRLARRVRQALGLLVCHPGSPLVPVPVLVPSLVSTTGQ